MIMQTVHITKFNFYATVYIFNAYFFFWENRIITGNVSVKLFCITTNAVI